MYHLCASASRLGCYQLHRLFWVVEFEVFLKVPARILGSFLCMVLIQGFLIYQIFVFAQGLMFFHHTSVQNAFPMCLHFE